MASKIDVKQNPNTGEIINAIDPTSPDQTNGAIAMTAAEKFKNTLHELELERTALATYAIETLKPGKAFNQGIIRDINRIETRKNRLIVARFAALLKKGEPGIEPIVHQIIEI